MSKYLKLFDEESQYQTFTGGTEYILPNVSHVINSTVTHYNPYIPPTPPAETRLVATFNVEDTSSDVLIYVSQNYANRDIESMEIDGVELENIVNTYRFDTIGEHTVKYVLINPTQVGEGVFNNNYSLTSIYIPNSVTSISNQAFYQCSGLTSINIPSGVTSINSWAFEGCSSLDSITVEATTPPTLGSGAFTNTNNCPIYVPSGSVNAYKAAEYWSNYASRIQAIS
jgi:hypothetical protein